MTHSNPTVTLSVRVPPEIRDQLKKLSDATGRTKSFLAAEAIESYLTVQAWQVKAIKKAVQKADSKEAKFLEHHKVVGWVKGWNTQDETEMPE